MSTIIRKIKKGIPKMDIQAMNLSIGHRLFLCFLGGIVIGTCMLNFFMDEYASSLGIYSEYFVNNVDMYGNDINKRAFFVYCIKKYVAELCFIFFLNITPVGKIFDKLYCFYKGVVISLLISAATVTYGAGGLILYIISIFPHYFLYVPFFAVTLYVSIQVAEMIKERNFAKFKIRALVILTLFAIGTAFLEAYINYPIIRAVF